MAKRKIIGRTISPLEARHVIHDLLDVDIFKDPTSRLAIVVNFLEELIGSEEFWQAFELRDWQRDIKEKLVHYISRSDAIRSTTGHRRFTKSLNTLIDQELYSCEHKQADDKSRIIIRACLLALGESGDAKIFLDLLRLIQWAVPPQDFDIESSKSSSTDHIDIQLDLGSCAAGLALLFLVRPGIYSKVKQHVQVEWTKRSHVIKTSLAKVVAEAVNFVLRSSSDGTETHNFIRSLAESSNDRLFERKVEMILSSIRCTGAIPLPAQFQSERALLDAVEAGIPLDDGFIALRTGHNRWIEKVRTREKYSTGNLSEDLRPVAESELLGALGNRSLTLKIADSSVLPSRLKATENYEQLIIPVLEPSHDDPGCHSNEQGMAAAYLVLYRAVPFTLEEIIFLAICASGLSRALPTISGQQARRILHLLEMPHVFWKVASHGIPRELEDLEQILTKSRLASDLQAPVVQSLENIKDRVYQMGHFLELMVEPAMRLMPINHPFETALQAIPEQSRERVVIQYARSANVYFMGLALQLVLTHLLQNALRYSVPDSQITVAMEIDEKDNALRVSVYSVPDNWEAAKEVLTASDLWSATKDKVSRNRGLGLPQCKTIAKAVNGDLNVELMETSPGVTFRFDIPVVLLTTKVEVNNG